MSDIPSRRLTLYFPLWGADFDSEGAGAVGGLVFACIPFPDEWRFIQQYDVWIERLRSRGAEEGEIPVCLTTFAQLEDEEPIFEGIERAGDALIRLLRDAVVVLRLYKSGWFLEPEFAESTFAVANPTGVWEIQRTPGPYRQAFLFGSQTPLTRYSLQIADLQTERDKPGSTHALWELLAAHRCCGANASVEIALENFNRSFGFQRSPNQRAADLFIALDTMLGGMSVRRIGKVSLRSRYFAKRLKAALEVQVGNANLLDPAKEVEWLNGSKSVRAIRNAIAHGRPNDAPALDTVEVERLQQIVRVLLRQYLGFAIVWAGQGESIRNRFGLDGNCSLAAAYNLVLEARARGEDDTTKMLDWRCAFGFA